MEKYKRGSDAVREVRRVCLLKAECYDSELRKRAYYEERRQFNESIEGLRDKEYRRILQSADKISVEADERLIAEADIIATKVYDHIVKILSAGRTLKRHSLGQHSEISFKEIREVFTLCVPAIKEVESLCEIECVDKKSGSARYNAYHTLLNKLVDFDIRFGLLCDLTAISRTIVEEKMTETRMLPSTLESLRAYKLKLEQDPTQTYINQTEIEDLIDWRYQTSRECIEQSRVARVESREIYKKAANQLAGEMLEFVGAEVARNWGKEYTEQELCRIIRHFSTVIGKLETLAKAINEEKYTQLPTALIEELIALEPRFIIIAPKSYLRTCDVDLSELSEEAQQQILGYVGQYISTVDGGYSV